MTDLHDTAEPVQEPQRRGRRTAVVAGVSVAVLAVLGGGAAAAAYLLGGGGTQPEEVLPASTLAEISVDLDPSASQKVEAVKTLRKFPGIKDGLDLGTGDDLRQWIFDQAVKDTGCEHLDFADDVKPWLGDRAALGGVDLAGKAPAPVVALQVADEAKARAGIQRLVECGRPGPDFGFAFADGYVVISDSTEHARTIVASGQESPLAADAGFTDLQGQMGDRGVVNFYVAPKAGAYLADHLGELSGTTVPSAESDAVSKRAADFKGLTGTVRFADGGVELAALARGAGELATSAKAGAAVAQLPDDTAVAIGFAAPKGYAQTLVDSFSQGSGQDPQRLTAEIETMSGLRLPEDLQTLLGTGVLLSLGGDAPDLRAVSSPADVPVGATILGDEARIQDILDRVSQRQGVSLDQLGVAHKSGEGRVVLATSDGYADKLLRPGHLGDTPLYREVVPEQDQAAAVEFVDFDSSWLGALLDAAGSSQPPAEVAKVRRNLEPLRALGVSAWVDGDTGHFLVKLTTD